MAESQKWGRPEEDDYFVAARIKAAALMNFFSPLLFNMIPCYVPGDAGLPTAAVDPAYRLYIEPEWFHEIGMDGAVATLLHEASHLFLAHFSRAQNYDNQAAVNVCQDAEINDNFDENQVKLPQGVIFPEILGLPRDKLWEQYYAMLPEELKQQLSRAQMGGIGGPGSEQPDPQGQGKQPGQQGAGNGTRLPNGTFVPTPNCGSGAHGRHQSWELSPNDKNYPGLDDVEIDEVQRQVADAIIKESQNSKTAGTVPAWAIERANEILRTHVDWRRYLSGVFNSYLGAAKHGGYIKTYRRRSRKFGVGGGKYIMPAYYKPTPAVCIVRDTSGSMTQQEFAIIMGWIDDFLSQQGFRNVPIIDCDAEVKQVQRVYSAEAARDFVGRGGTNMMEGLYAAAQLRPKPDITFVFTDGYTPWDDVKPRGLRKVVVGVIGEESVLASIPSWATGYCIDPVTLKENINNDYLSGPGIGG